VPYRHKKLTFAISSHDEFLCLVPELMLAFWPSRNRIDLPVCFCKSQDYSTDNMTENQKRFLQHLREFGLVYQRKVCGWCYQLTSLYNQLATWR